MASYAHIKAIEDKIKAYERTIELQRWACIWHTATKEKFFKKKIKECSKILKRLKDDYENEVYDRVSGN